MKKLFTFLAVLTACSYLHASERFQENSSYTDFYTTFGFISDKTQEYIPSISIGKKSVSKKGNGIDFGATFGFLGRHEKKDDFVLMFPRIEYIHYGSKDFNKINGYVGLGACTTTYRVKQGSFEGIAGNVTIGFDFYREKNMNGFIQAKTYYPLLSIKENYDKGFTLVFIDVGLGF
jgi:hypothetical protein